MSPPNSSLQSSVSGSNGGARIGIRLSRGASCVHSNQAIVLSSSSSDTSTSSSLSSPAYPDTNMSQIIYSDPALEQIICSALAQHTLSYNLHHRLAMCHTATDRPPINAEFERHISSEVAQQVRKSFAKVDLETVQIIVNTLRLDSVTRAILQRGDIDPGVLGVAYNRASKGGGISDVGLLARALYAPVLDTVRNAVTRYIDTHGPLRTRVSVPILAETTTTSTSIIHSALSSTFHPREPSGESRSLTEYVSLLLPFVHTLELSEIVKNELVFIDSFSRKLVDDKWPTYVSSGEMNLSSLLAQEIMFSGHGASPQFLHTMRQVLVAPEIMSAIEYLVPSVNPGTLPAMFYDTLRHDASPTATQLALDIYRPLIERLRNFLLEDFPAPGPGKLRPAHPIDKHFNGVVSRQFIFAPGKAIQRQHGAPLP